VSLYFTMGLHFPLKQSAPSHRGSGPPSNTWFTGPTWLLNSNGILISSAVFAGLSTAVWQTDRQTDWPTDRPPRYLVSNNRPIPIRSTAMQPNNKYAILIHTSFCCLNLFITCPVPQSIRHTVSPPQVATMPVSLAALHTVVASIHNCTTTCILHSCYLITPHTAVQAVL